MSKRIREAASIDCGPCDFCPAVHVNFFDKAGNVFATASVPLENVDPFVARFKLAAFELSQRHSAPELKQ